MIDCFFKVGDIVNLRDINDNTDKGRISSVVWDYDHWIIEVNGEWWHTHEVVPDENGMIVNRNQDEML
jgi:hypothetical protein